MIRDFEMLIYGVNSMKPTSSSGQADLKTSGLPSLDGRICYIDNIRFLLIMIVVCGHFVERAGVFTSLYKFIYSFHMPAFIFLSGYVAKKDTKADKKIGLAVLYIVTIFCFWAFRKYALGANVKLTFFNPTPYTGTWYLLALFIWSLIFPLFENLQPVVAMVIAVAMGLLAGIDNTIGNYMSLSRIVVFFPFYLLGYYSRKNRILETMKSRKYNYIIAAVIVVLFAVLTIKYNKSIRIWQFTCKRSYSLLKMSNLKGMANRAMFYCTSTLLSFSIFMLVPSCKTFFTKLGRNTIAVYWCHLLLIIWLAKTEMLEKFVASHSPYWIFPMVIAVTFFFSIPFWSKPFNLILSAKYSRLFRKRENKK